MNYVGRMSEQVNDNMKAEKIQEFNAKITGYADRGEYGYLGYQDAISVQEFVKIYNLIKNWNQNNESDIIEIKFATNGENVRTTAEKSDDIRLYLKDFKPTSEEILSYYFRNEREPDPKLRNKSEQYYFEFRSNETEYENTEGRISSITLRMKKIKT